MLWESTTEDALKESWAKLQMFHASIDVHWASTPDWTDPPALTFLTPAIPPHRYEGWGLSSQNSSTEIELSLVMAEKKKMKIHAVTGSVGKSTTVKLLSEALKVPALGNIGRSLLECDTCGWPTEVVMELSSFQLHHLQSLKFRPSSFILTPVLDHHANWHGGVEAYQNCKLSAVAEWKGQAEGVMPDTDLSAASSVFGEKEVSLLGEHNRENLLRVVELLRRIGEWDESKSVSLMRCSSLPHRLEVVTEKDNRLWVNDSKATSPMAVIKAIESVDVGTLILDGLWSVNPSDLMDVIDENDISTILVGGAHALEKECLRRRFPLAMATSLKDAVSMTRSGTGDVLYSPGAPSYDRYSNFEKRGEDFLQKVKSLIVSD